MQKKLNLLWADDDDSFAMLIDRIVQKPELTARCVVHRVNDGTDAVDYVLGRELYADRARYPAPDAVVLDQRMCKMDGAEALAEIRKDDRGRTTLVCLCSTSAQPRLYDLCYSNAAVFCFQKPMDFDNLALKVELLIRFFTDVLELPRKVTNA